MHLRNRPHNSMDTVRFQSSGRLRLARLSDLSRIGIVSTAAFFHDTFFHYTRPWCGAFPEDTVAVFEAGYQNGILDPDSVVLVAVDKYESKELGYVYHALKEVYPDFEANTKDDPDEVIVGVIGLSLQHNPGRYGQFNPEGTPYCSASAAVRPFQQVSIQC